MKYCLYSGTCLIRHTKGPGKCVGLYRMSEYSSFIYVNRTTLGPYIFIGCHRGWRSLGDIPSIPLAFFTLILLMRFDTKSSVIGWKSSLDIDSYSYLLFISIMLGWVSSPLILLSPIFLATLTNKLLTVSHIFCW